MSNNEALNIAPEDQEKVRCYGSNAAATVEATTLRKNDSLGTPTINVDVAPKNGPSFQWDRKITVQLTVTELPIFACVCLGYLPKAEFKRSTKGIVLERQKNKIYVNATQGSGNSYSLPIPIGDTFQVTALVLKQLHRQTALSDSGLMIAALRGAASLYAAP